jgi:curved DNA-binding protein CbpA
MKHSRDYYRLLQVQSDAPFEIIRASYRALMRELKNHPDLGGDHHKAALLNEAFTTLSDAGKRKKYDIELIENDKISPFIEKKPFANIGINSISGFSKKLSTRDREAGHILIASRNAKKTVLWDNGLSHDCRRSVARIKNTGTIWLPEKRIEAKMRDISLNGICFTSDEKFNSQSIIKLESPLLKAVAKVKTFRRILSTQEPIFSVGAQFLTVSFLKEKGLFFSAYV